jgi:choline dehydrogenase-like flavoprotein
MMTTLLTSDCLLTSNTEEARLVTAIAERLFPADVSGPGATEIDVLTCIDRALAGDRFRERPPAAGDGCDATWRGPSFTGVCSSHDLGGCRMGDDPATSVVDVDPRVHDTPGPYVFSGAVFPSCPGVKPNLTSWALVHRAADRLVEKLRH